MIRLIFRIFLAATLFAFGSTSASEWFRGNSETNKLMWGAKDGLRFAIPPSGFKAREPRGLIRLGYPILTNGGYDLVNFIAVEPIVQGRKGFSELERSTLDASPGKRLWLISEDANDQRIKVHIGVERFDNGAEVSLEIEQRADRPDEILITTRAAANSASIQQCILTATMGNMIRARQLWLGEKMVTAQQLYPDYKDIHFAPHKVFGADKLLRLKDGTVIAAISPDEASPAETMPFPTSNFWHYRGAKVTQFWKHPGTNHTGLTLAVNARHTYYGSKREIPGGNSFENFEMRAPFKDGQQFIFGITKAAPQDLGFRE